MLLTTQQTRRYLIIRMIDINTEIYGNVDQLKSLEIYGEKIC